jgi:hypothetical protein
MDASPNARSVPRYEEPEGVKRVGDCCPNCECSGRSQSHSGKIISKFSNDFNLRRFIHGRDSSSESVNAAIKCFVNVDFRSIAARLLAGDSFIFRFLRRCTIAPTNYRKREGTREKRFTSRRRK